MLSLFRQIARFPRPCRRLYATGIWLLLLIPYLPAQHRHIQHQTFALNGVERVQLDLTTDYEAVSWEGTVIMTEVKVELYNASPAMMKKFVEGNRYDLEGNLTGETLNIRSLERKWDFVQTNYGESQEIVQVKIFVPSGWSVEEDIIVPKTD
ncbi:MAG: hypothetical protein R3350_07835 [Saprospiraceae bacterium]|nr:hypothetical protein [Saprospiraceae bacterium]